MKVPFTLLASLLAFTGYVATSSKAARTDATIPSKFPMLTAFPTNSVYAGHNCKCQIGGDGSPQDDNASALCCLIQQDNGGFINQVGGISFHPDQHHQVIYPFSETMRESLLTSFYSAAQASIRSIAVHSSSAARTKVWVVSGLIAGTDWIASSGHGNRRL
jgi:hypothetical protein